MEFTIQDLTPYVVRRVAGRGREQGGEARAIHQTLTPGDFFDVLGTLVDCIC